MTGLIACEESQEVTKAFRLLGHEVFSCDLQPCSGGHPEWHLLQDVVDVLLGSEDKFWDFILIHIPCTKFAVSGNRWYGSGMPRHNERIEAIVWWARIWELVKQKSKRCAVENPKSVLFSHITYENIFYIQPWQFGHGEVKCTGFATVGLPKLIPTNIVDGREARVFNMWPSENRAKLRSKTFPGVAAAIASQWG